MTSFRGRPSGKHARTWDDRDRRSMLLNIGFGVTIVAALLLLVIAFAASWYDDNLARHRARALLMPTVSGQQPLRCQP